MMLNILLSPGSLEPTYSTYSSHGRGIFWPRHWPGWCRNSPQFPMAWEWMAMNPWCCKEGTSLRWRRWRFLEDFLGWKSRENRWDGRWWKHFLKWDRHVCLTMNVIGWWFRPCLNTKWMWLKIIMDCWDGRFRAATELHDCQFQPNNILGKRTTF